MHKRKSFRPCPPLLAMARFLEKISKCTNYLGLQNLHTCKFLHCLGINDRLEGLFRRDMRETKGSYFLIACHTDYGDKEN